jgi:hypothetical protein
MRVRDSYRAKQHYRLYRNSSLLSLKFFCVRDIFFFVFREDVKCTSIEKVYHFTLLIVGSSARKSVKCIPANGIPGRVKVIFLVQCTFSIFTRRNVGP